MEAQQTRLHFQNGVTAYEPHPSLLPSSMSKRIRIFTASDVLRHNSESSCWITYRGKVLDVTYFLADHPGGEEFILKYAGRDVENAMKDADEHAHSESAYDMLDEFRIGRLGAEESVVSDDWVATDDFTPEDTDEAADYEKNQFLDLRKPLMQQMWDGNFRHVFLCEVNHDRVVNDHHFPQQSILSSTSPSAPTPPRIGPSLWIPSA